MRHIAIIFTCPFWIAGYLYQTASTWFRIGMSDAQKAARNPLMERT